MEAQFDALYAFVADGDLTKKLVESAIITFFLALLAPLVQLIRAQERKRQLAHDIMLFLQFEQMASENRLLGRAAANYVKKNTHLDAIVEKIAPLVDAADPGAEPRAQLSADEIEQAISTIGTPAPYNVWDLFGSLVVPVGFWLLFAIGMTVEGGGAGEDTEFIVASLLVAAPLSLVLAYVCGRKVAKVFMSEALQRTFQVLLSIFSIFVAYLVAAVGAVIVVG